MNCSPKITQIYANSFRENFDLPCLSDYNTKESLTYGQFAQDIACTHLLFHELGIKPGDKIALLGKNNINWVTAFMATITYGAVIVPILNEFNPHDAQHIINHSDSLLLLVSDSSWESIHWDGIPAIRGALSLDRRVCLDERDNFPLSATLELIPEIFKKKYPAGFTSEDITYQDFDDDATAVLNYTSGTTGFSKGVMLPNRSLWGNVDYGMKSHLHYRGSRALSFLPLAHAYGCAFDMLTPLATGTHITLLGRAPTPRVLLSAFKDVRPNLIVCVPLILEKIYKRMIVPQLSKRTMRWVMAIPLMDKAVGAMIRRKLIDAFGGAFEEVIVGGAPLNHEVEQFLCSIHFPLTVGYGMTECGPLISYTHWRNFIPGSAGRALPGYMTAKIVARQEGTLGEVAVKGVNVMTGYYKSPEATEAVLDEDGWLHTGDMGTLGGPDGQTIFLRGRYKTMILTATGQNVYPEEIESKLNNMRYVAESLVVERNGHLVALVYPDSEQTDVDSISDTQLPQTMEDVRKDVNKLLAPYERIEKIELRDAEFEKTPKKSIKRFLYS